jgi:hypothetical protein
VTRTRRPGNAAGAQPGTPLTGRCHDEAVRGNATVSRVRPPYRKSPVREWPHTATTDSADNVTLEGMVAASPWLASPQTQGLLSMRAHATSPIKRRSTGCRDPYVWDGTNRSRMESGLRFSTCVLPAANSAPSTGRCRGPARWRAAPGTSRGGGSKVRCAEPAGVRHCARRCAREGLGWPMRTRPGR